MIKDQLWRCDDVVFDRQDMECTVPPHSMLYVFYQNIWVDMCPMKIEKLMNYSAYIANDFIRSMIKTGVTK